jgi:predicted ATPase with chaperone activity
VHRRPVRGAIPAALAAAEAERKLILSANNDHEIDMIAQSKYEWRSTLGCVPSTAFRGEELPTAIAVPTANTQQGISHLQNIIDQLPEFERELLDALRESWNPDKIVISRASAKAYFSARVQLIAAINPRHTGAPFL